MSMSPRTNVIETVRQHRDNLLSRGVGAFTTGAIAGIASAAKEVLIDKLPLFPSPEQTPIVLENAGIVAIEGTLFSIAG